MDYGTDQAEERAWLLLEITVKDQAILPDLEKLSRRLELLSSGCICKQAAEIYGRNWPKPVAQIITDVTIF